MTQAQHQAVAPAATPAPAVPASAPAARATTVDVPRLLNKWQLIAVASCVASAHVSSFAPALVRPKIHGAS